MVALPSCIQAACAAAKKAMGSTNSLLASLVLAVVSAHRRFSPLAVLPPEEDPVFLV